MDCVIRTSRKESEESMTRTVRSLAMILIAVSILVAGPGLQNAASASSAAAADYPWQSSASMTVRYAQTGVSTGCVATAWIGMNDYGYLSGYGTLSCNKKYFHLGDQVQLTRNLAVLSESYPHCYNCTYLYGGVSSGVGSPGVQYCTRVWIDIGAQVQASSLSACTSR